MWPQRETISAIILAAGQSFQMKDFKPLLKLGNVTAVEHCIRCFFQAGVNDIRVVGGYRILDLVEAIKHYDVRLVLNKHFHKGMYSSVQEGARTLEPGIRAFFILPADNPFIKVSTVHKLIDRFQAEEDPGIIYPVFKGRRGHPPLISTRYVDEILNSSYPGGLGEFLEKQGHGVLDVEVADEGVLLDMNNPEEYLSLLSYMKVRGGSAVPGGASGSDKNRQAGARLELSEKKSVEKPSHDFSLKTTGLELSEKKVAEKPAPSPDPSGTASLASTGGGPAVAAKPAGRPADNARGTAQNLSGRAQADIRVNYKLHLEKNGVALQEDLFKILTLIGSSGSLVKAAEKMGMSYRLAWGKIRALEKDWGMMLINTKVGGNEGGGTALTQQARILLHKYGATKQAFDRLTLEQNKEPENSLPAVAAAPGIHYFGQDA